MSRGINKVLDSLKGITKSLRKFPRWFTRQPIKTRGAIMIAMIALIFMTDMYLRPQVMIMGYDGIVSKVAEVNSEADYEIDFQDLSSAGLDPPGYYSGIFWIDPTGLKIEIQSGVNVLRYEDLTEPINVTTDNGDGTYTHKLWAIRRAICNFSATVKTYGVGFEPIEDIEFWISLSENEFSVFQEADETYAYILAIYTTAAATKVGILDAVPEAGGYYFPYTTVRTHTVPQWLLDSGYTGDLAGMAEVKFLIRVEKAQPTTWMSLWREESQMTFHIGVDVFMAGYWEKTTDYKEWKPPKPEEPWWAWLGEIFEGETPILMLIVIAVVIYLVARAAKSLFAVTPTGRVVGAVMK